jgi:hypothetical protein
LPSNLPTTWIHCDPTYINPAIHGVRGSGTDVMDCQVMPTSKAPFHLAQPTQSHHSCCWLHRTIDSLVSILHIPLCTYPHILNLLFSCLVSPLPPRLPEPLSKPRRARLALLCWPTGPPNRARNPSKTAKNPQTVRDVVQKPARTPKTRGTSSKSTKMAPQDEQVDPKMAQDSPKISPRWPKLTPRCPQEGPKTPQDSPKMAKMSPR